MTFPVFSAGTSAYNLTNSLRFRSSASAYLNRTPASASNRKTWTWSGWVKRGALEGAFQSVFEAGNVSDQTTTELFFSSDNTLRLTAWTGASSPSAVTTAVFRDPSAWYHIVAVFNSPNATADDRMILYVNNVRQALSTNLPPTQNLDWGVNNNWIHTLGRTASSAVGYFDGYMAEINFIDGQALTPSRFGSTNAVTGVWQPAKYTGTYGTNGFYLPFTNTTSTTTLGNDFSGNGNNWTTNNISLTPGVTYDSMTDVPTLTSPTAANFAVLNPLSTASVFSITNGNLTASSSTPTGTQPASFFLTSGKWYWESIGNAYAGAVCGLNGARFTGSISATGSNGIGYWEGGLVYWDGGNSGAGPASYTSSDVIGVALDMNAGTVAFYKNNSLQFTATFGSGTVPNLSSGCFPCYNQGQSGSTKTANFNFGQRPFAYTPPSGFVALNTFNLPSSTIPAGNKYMDATTYTGNGSTQSIVNSGSMQPDWVWVKSRSNAYGNYVNDSVRGASQYLETNTTGAEGTAANSVTSFNSNGFSVGSNLVYNFSGYTYVGWQWKGGGTAVTNTAGSSTSTVSANTTSGFSVVTYTGTGANATVGHGLNVLPSMVIAKNRSGTGDWAVWHTSLGDNILRLNTTGASTSSTPNGVFNVASFTSSVFAVGNGTVNVSASTYVAYCFAQIAGFSSFGSYTGNGSTDGPFIYTGFRPRFVMTKRTDSTNDWTIHDTARDPTNTTTQELYPNSSSAEFGPRNWDILSNGFKLRTATGSDPNVNGGTYIYACFAENPFKNALAR